MSYYECASTKDQAESIQFHNSEDSSKTDIFSRHLDDRLLHRILEYDTKSTGRMAKANRALKKLAVGSRAFRFFEGAGWDMPELANICEFGVTDIRNRPQLKAEIAMIMAFSHTKDETVFNYNLTNLLLNGKVFKELSKPVLKYLVRRFYERKEHLKDKDGAKRQKFLIFAVKHRVFDVFFELSKDSSVWNGKKLDDIVKGDIHDCFYFDCYNNYVYGNRAANPYMQSKLTKIAPTDYVHFCNFSSGGETFSRTELYSWAAVCIYRRVPEESYTQHLSKIPIVFLDIIQEYIYKYSLINFDDDEKDYFHSFITLLLVTYFENDKNSNPFYDRKIAFTKLLNDFRFGNFDDSFYDNRISPLKDLHSQQIAMLSMAASKANKKSLVKQSAKHPYFQVTTLESYVECKYPQSFKVYFDIIENEPLQNLNGNTNYANTKLIQTILNNDFKIISTVTEPFGATFKFQSPVEYIKLGFAPTYEIVLEPEDQFVYGRSLIEKMLNDSAKSGPEDFVRLITEHCGEQAIKPNLLCFYKLNVSYEVIQLLLEHQELIQMLANRMVGLKCTDKRINPEEIENLIHAII